MSIRIGVGFGGWPFPAEDPAALWEYVYAAEALDIDSIWLSDRIVSSALNLEPVVALSFMAARTKRLKFGTSVLALPLRNPTILAKEIATLGLLSEGRIFPAIGLVTEDEREFDSLVLATTNTPEDELTAALAGSQLEIHAIGDTVSARTAAMAIYEGRKLGRRL